MLQSIPPGGLVARKPEEIGNILQQLLESRQTVRTLASPDGTHFESRLLYVDPERRYICLAAAASEQANASLLARPRASFVASAPSWHYEFAAATPQLSQLGGTRVIRMAFPAMVVYAQELLPGRVGMIAGLFFGLSFGLSGIAAAVLGALADATSITYVYKLCAFLPAIGLLAVFLPNFKAHKK